MRYNITVVRNKPLKKVVAKQLGILSQYVVFLWFCQLEREIERERERQRQRQRETERQTDRQTDKQTDSDGKNIEQQSKQCLTLGKTKLRQSYQRHKDHFPTSLNLQYNQCTWFHHCQSLPRLMRSPTLMTAANCSPHRSFKKKCLWKRQYVKLKQHQMHLF